MEETTSFPIFIWHYTCVPGGNGIRGSKDPRAEIGKFPNSTNERKQMSSKTLRKRIAVVAVSALTAGLFSVVSTPAANSADLTAHTAVAESNMTISDSICGATSLVGTTPIALDGTATDTSPFETTATGKIVTVPVGGILTVGYDADDVITVSGPLSIQNSTGETVGITNGKVTITGGNADSTTVLSASAVGTATLVAGTAADPTPTAANTIRVNIVAACASSTFVAATSFVSVEDTSTTAADNVDTSATQADTEQGFLSIVAKSQYGSVVPSGTWIVSATNGARVAITTNASAAAASTTGPSQAFATGAGTDVRVAVAQATEGVAQTSVVTVTYNGALVATRSFAWTGDLASITVSSVRLGYTGAANYNSFVVRTFDAAGNQIAWPNASLTVEGFDQNVTTGDAVATATASGESAATNDGNFFTCGSGAKSTTKLKVKGIAGTLAAVYSPEFSASCSTSTRTYTASLDKATYVPGDIATLTITAKDVNGNAVFDPTSTAADDTNDTFNYVNAGVSGTAQAIGYSNLTPVVAPAAGDFFLGGVKTYQFVVGATEGDYQLTLGINGITTDTAKTVKYSIKASTATVTNADVLKSIVALIASINKQIQALQKLILARR